MYTNQYLNNFCYLGNCLCFRASSASVLLPLLVSTAPYIGKHVYMQECYTRNLIQVTTYIPSLRLNLIEIVVHRIIEFDVSKTVETK